MKKYIKILLSLALIAVMLASQAALAAEGDVTVQLKDELSNIYNPKLFSLNGHVYFLSSYQTDVYEIDTTSGEVSLVDIAGLESLQPETSSTDIAADQDEFEMDYSTESPYYFQGVTSDAGNAYMIISQPSTQMTEDDYITTTKLFLAELTVDGDSLKCEKLTEFTTDLLLEIYETSSWAKDINSSAVMGDKLILSAYNEQYDQTLFCMDLKTLEVSPLENLSNLVAYTPYQDRQLIIIRYNSDYSALEYVLYGLDGSTTLLYTNPVSFSTATPYAPVYEAATDTLFAACDGALCAVRGLDFEHKETICPMPAGVSSQTGLLLADGRYAAAAQECIAIRSTIPNAQSEGKVTIATENTWLENVTASYYTFMNTHGNVDVYLSSETGNVLESMMNRDSSVDVYMLHSNSNAFDAIYTRGFMAPIRADKLGMEDMYDFARSFCTVNGEVVCYPVYASGWTISYNQKALEAAQIPVSELPTNWTDFIHKLPEYAQKLEDVNGYNLFGNWMTQESARYSLIQLILDQYYNEQTVMGITEMGYRTPELQSALEAVQALDMNALGITLTNSDEESGMMEMPYSETEAAFSFYFNYQPDGWYNADERPLFLTVYPNAEPTVATSVLFAFINPFTQNYDAAVAYIETLADTVIPQYSYSFTAKDNKPVRYSWYEENIANIQQMIDEYTSYMQSSESAEDKMFFEEQLKDWENYLVNAEENDWQIKPMAIEAYQALASKITIQRFNPMYTEGDSVSEIYELVNQLVNGTTSVNDFLTQVDRKVQMMILEGN